MEFDWKLVVQGVMLLLTVSAIYWRLHYHQKGTGDKIIEHENKLFSHDEKITRHELDLIGLRAEMNCRIKELEFKIEEKLTENSNKLSRRLQRIEKILIKMDERSKTNATDELVKEDA